MRRLPPGGRKDGWATEVLKNYLLTPRPWVSLMVVLVTFAVWLLVKKGFHHFRNNDSSGGRHQNNLRLGQNLCKWFLIGLAVITVLQINGINVTSLITGLGVAGVVVGFALEDLLKDIINGANIVWEGFFAVGDMVVYHRPDGSVVEGKVLSFDLKATKILDAATGNTLTVSNRNISEIEQMSDWVPLDVPAPYGVPAEQMRRLCREMCERLAGLPHATGCSFVGTAAFGESQILYKLLLHCPPEYKKTARFAALGIIQDMLAQAGVEVPFNRLDVALVQPAQNDGKAD